jgi:hypothetical protein
MRRPALAGLGALLWLVASSAEARIERFAVVIGNNRGAAGEVELKYAEADATRVYDVLLALGDVSPLNSVIVRGRDAGFVRSALLAFNERIRAVSEVSTWICTWEPRRTS